MIDSYNSVLNIQVHLLSFQACSKFLAETEDLDDSLATPLSSLSAILVEPFIQHHKTKEVRLLAACCIAELFRLFYPDPPYDEDQLKVSIRTLIRELFYNPNPEVVLRYHPNTYIGLCIGRPSRIHWLFARSPVHLLSM